MFRLFKRKPVEPPPVEWRCGRGRAPRILDALTHAVDSTVSLFRNGKLEWTVDAAMPLHQFTCRPLDRVLAFAKEHEITRTIPAFVPSESAARHRRDDTQTDSNLTEHGEGSLKQIVLKFPLHFEEAVDVKRRWLAGDANDEDVQHVTQKFSDSVRDCWPSGFCLGINGIRNAEWCALSALNIGSPWDAAQGCATTAANFAGCHLACHAVGCPSTCPDQNQLVWEAGTVGEREFVRGVGCAQVFDAQIEQRASSILDATYTEWWEDFNDELEATLIEFAS